MLYGWCIVKISIVTAVYNRERTIGQALESVAAQTYGDIEHIVQDGGSTDGTLSILAAHIHRIKSVSAPDAGIYDAINKGIARTTGEIVGLMHSDDFFARPDILDLVARAFEDPTIDGVYGDLDYVAADDPMRIVRQWRSGNYSPAKLRRGWMPPHPTLYLRRDVFDRWGAYDTSLRIAADYDAMLRWLSNGVRLAYVPEVFVKMRVGGASNGSLGRILRKSREDYIALKRNHVGGAGALAWKNLSKLGQFVAKS